MEVILLNVLKLPLIEHIKFYGLCILMGDNHLIAVCIDVQNMH